MTGDIKIKWGYGVSTSIRRIVAAGSAASINPGEPTKQGSSGAVAIMVDGDGTTSQRFTGVAKSVSTDTASAAGEVYVIDPIPQLTYSCRAKSAAAFNTQAEIDALLGSRVIFDLTSTTWSIDTAAGDSATNCVVITGGEPATSTVFFQYSPTGLFTE